MRGKTREDSVREFHEAFNVDIDKPYSKNLLIFRNSLITEEYEELKEEMASALVELQLLGEVSTKTKSRILKELADLQYVLSGMAVAFGLPLDVAFNRVHQSNMSKLGPDGKAVYREDGKVLKGPNYKLPDLEDLVE